MGGRSIKDNFKKRFGDPARIEIRYATEKMSPSEDAYRSEQISKVYAGVLKGVLGREPTQNEILGNKDISTKLRKK
jgi:N-acetyl-anhydromuramyl-L-alanine amidase AmpD